MKIALHFIAVLVSYAMLDLAFINLFAKDFIRRQVGDKLAEKPDLYAAGLFYFIFVFGLLYFCIWPASSLSKAVMNGAFFGLVTYATYELVNKSLLAGWPLALVAVDMAWGVFVGAAVSGIGFLAGHYLNR
ncbi:MAG: DUF2177 family protein [Saprospiraceae bacterium]|nr:DUF2177 family protein [Saprospiraceae bacterium]